MQSHKPRRALTSALFVSLVCQPIVCQVTWTQLAPTNSPVQRTEVIMASDGTGALMFGGVILNNIYVGDIWRFDGADWTDLNPPAPIPSIRGRLAGDWDLIRQRLVVFGGQGPGGALGDTWEYDPAANTWANLQPAVAPGPRIHARMAYQLRSLSMIMFGGGRTAETWSWDGSTWSDLTASTTMSPSGRDQVNMATNTRTGEIVLYGGTTNSGNSGINGETWIWNGTDWRPVLTSTIPGGTGIRNGKLTYDEVRDRMILFGGVKGTGGFSSSVWEFDGVDWTERSTGSSPVPRAGMGLAFVPSHGTTFMFSGYPYPPQNETWSYQTSTIATYTTGGAGCAGTRGAPRLTGTEPWLGEVLTLTVQNTAPAGPTLLFFGSSITNSGVGPLPLNLGFLGAANCSLQVDPLLLFPMVTSNGTATLTAPLPLAPAYAGVVFYNQAYTVDSTANAAGLVVSNYGKATTGLR